VRPPDNTGKLPSFVFGSQQRRPTFVPPALRKRLREHFQALPAMPGNARAEEAVRRTLAEAKGATPAPSTARRSTRQPAQPEDHAVAGAAQRR
jgi:hypothetical protein